MCIGWTGKEGCLSGSDLFSNSCLKLLCLSTRYSDPIFFVKQNVVAHLVVNGDKLVIAWPLELMQVFFIFLVIKQQSQVRAVRIFTAGREISWRTG